MHWRWRFGLLSMATGAAALLAILSAPSGAIPSSSEAFRVQNIDRSGKADRLPAETHRALGSASEALPEGCEAMVSVITRLPARLLPARCLS